MRKMFSEKQIEELAKKSVNEGIESGEVEIPSPSFKPFEEVVFEVEDVQSVVIEFTKTLKDNSLYFLKVWDGDAEFVVCSGIIAGLSDEYQCLTDMDLEPVKLIFDSSANTISVEYNAVGTHGIEAYLFILE